MYFLYLFYDQQLISFRYAPNTVAQITANEVPKLSETFTVKPSSIPSVVAEQVVRPPLIRDQVWSGCIFAVGIAKFLATAQPVSGIANFMCDEVPDTIPVNGRLMPQQVLTYIDRLKDKESSSKEVTIVALFPASPDDHKSYSMLFQYLNSRDRYGVATLANPTKNIKDGYLIPYSANSSVPSALLPFDGPGKFSVDYVLMKCVLEIILTMFKVTCC